MATGKTPATGRQHRLDDPPIVIERREVVATIMPDPQGTMSMIAAAFLSIGQYYADHDDGEGLSLEFSYFDRTFHATLDPITVPSGSPDPDAY